MIPEPSEEDWEKINYGLRLYDNVGREIERRQLRVIAHLVRNGAVLARNIDLDHVTEHDEVMNAIMLFERVNTKAKK